MKNKQIEVIESEKKIEGARFGLGRHLMVKM